MRIAIPQSTMCIQCMHCTATSRKPAPRNMHVVWLCRGCVAPRITAVCIYSGYCCSTHAFAVLCSGCVAAHICSVIQWLCCTHAYHYMSSLTTQSGQSPPFSQVCVSHNGQFETPSSHSNPPVMLASIVLLKMFIMKAT